VSLPTNRNASLVDDVVRMLAPKRTNFIMSYLKRE